MALSPLISRHILPFALKMLYASLRITVTPHAWKMELADKGAILTFWHGKMATGWLFARALFPGKKLSAVVSLSKDGQTLSDALESFDFTLIRGSSSKGGDEVKRDMQEAIKRGDIVVLTPDGPRGPVEQFKYGTLRIASSNRYHLVFAEISYEHAWKLKSWDRFEIPKPFSRAAIILHTLELPLFESEAALRLYTANLSDRFGHA